MQKFLITSLVLGLNIFMAGAIWAVDIHLVDYLRGQEEDKAVLYLDTGSEKVNAVSGRLIFDKNKITTESLIEGNSAFTLGLEKRIDNNQGIIDFAVVAPGGFAGKGEIVTVNFKKLSGSLVGSTIKFDKVEAFRNDGLGTNLPVTVSYSPPSIFADLPRFNNRDDNTPPELFTPIVSRDASVLGGGKYLFFSTVDKGSGVKDYSLAKSWRYFNLQSQSSYVAHNLKWQRIAGPSLLLGWSPLSFHYLKVSDYAGNFVLVEVKDLRPIYVSWLFWVIIIFSAIGVWIWRKKIKR